VSGALIWCPFASEDAAAAAAGQLLDEGLIACANILPGMRSLYVWQGERGEARECGALFKTDAGLLEHAVARLAAIHPYDTPAIAGWRADVAPPATLAWLGELV
jgi:periplasmic divalent cation tolerance protein